MSHPAECGEQHHKGEHRGKRLFAHGELRLIVLDILSQQASHGYELIKSIEALTCGHYTPSAGVVYPTLEYLREQAFIADGAEEQGRKQIMITDNGRCWLEEQREPLQQIKQRIKARTLGHKLRRNPAMKQALDQLKGALDISVNREDIDQAAIEKVIAILHRAAEDIAALDNNK